MSTSLIRLVEESQTRRILEMPPVASQKGQILRYGARSNPSVADVIALVAQSMPYLLSTRQQPGVGLDHFDVFINSRRCVEVLEHRAEAPLPPASKVDAGQDFSASLKGDEGTASR